jgi:hypothetical protein
MSVTKRVSGDYNLVTLNGNVQVATTNFTINGNLFVIGTASKIESTDTYIYDNFITLNAGVTGTPILNAGIEVNRGSSPNASFQWNESLLVWEVYNGTIWKQLTTRVFDDKDPHLGGDLNTNGFEIYCDTGQEITVRTDATGALNLQTIVKLKQTLVDPAAAVDYSVLYAKPAGAGDTGLYVTNEKKSSEELITRRRALIYSLIL